MSAELPQPGVEVLQIFRTQTPTIIAPTLPACVIGPCKQIVDATQRSASGATLLNPQAVVSLPAALEADAASGDPPVYTLLDSVLVFSPNRRPKVSVSFSAGDYTPVGVINKINAALALAGETQALAERIGKTPKTGTSWRLRTVAKGSAQYLALDPSGHSSAVQVGNVDLDALGPGVFGGGGTLHGTTVQFSIDGGATITTTFAAPADVAAILSQLNTTLGVTATASKQATTNFLLVTAASDGELSTVEIVGGTALVILGLTASTQYGEGSTASLMSAFGFDTNDVAFGEDSYAGYEMRIPAAAYPDPRENLDELALEFDSVRTFVGISGNTALREALRTSAVLRSGGAVTATDDGNGDNRTPFVNMAGQDFTSLSTVPSQGRVTGASAPTFASLQGKTLVVGEGRHPRTVTFPACAAIADVVNAINEEFDTNDGVLASSSGGFLRITCTKLREDGATDCLGEDSQVVLYGGSALVPTNFLDSNVAPTLKIGRYAGDPQKVAVGDELWVDGVFVGSVTQVAPGGVATRLRLDREVPTSFTGTSFYIVALRLQALPAGAVDRPAPSLIVRSSGELLVKLGLLRNTQGQITEAINASALISGKGPLYVAYRALRLDVTASAANPGLLQFETTTDVDALLEPTSPDNPLALGLYFALLNGPDTSVYGLGIDEVSADSPEGTVEAYTRAAALLESQEVYGIVPLSHSEDVAQVLSAHVLSMSSAENKGERILLWNPSRPTHQRHSTVASGVDGGTVGNTGLTFDTGVADLAALLLSAGLDPTSDFAVDEGVFLDIASDSKAYSILSVAGSVVTIKTTFLPGENDDSFYSTTDLNDAPLPSVLIDEPFAIRVRGALLELSNGQPDKDKIADTLAALGQSFRSSRVWQIVPESITALISGIEQTIDGYYAAAAIAGAIGQQPPQQSFTNFPMTGISSVKGTRGYFTDKQMNRMMAGGNYILIQGDAGGPVYSRMALTTDTTSIELRTDSIIKVVDFTAKFLRRSLRNFIGRFNIGPGLLDSLGTTLEGLLSYLKENRILNGAEVNNIIQSEDAPDTVIIDIGLSVPYPCNYIRLSLVILDAKPKRNHPQGARLRGSQEELRERHLRLAPEEGA